MDHHGAAALAGCGTAAASGWGRTGCGRGRCGPTAWSVAAVVRVVAAPAVAEPMGEPAALVEAPATRHAGPAGRPWAAPAWDLGPAAPSCRSASCRRSTRLPHPVTIRSQPERTLRPAVSVTHFGGRALDPSRPVVSNEGWEHLDSDILGVHDYSSDVGLVTENGKPKLPLETIHQIVTGQPHRRRDRLPPSADRPPFAREYRSLRSGTARSGNVSLGDEANRLNTARVGGTRGATSTSANAPGCMRQSIAPWLAAPRPLAANNRSTATS